MTEETESKGERVAKALARAGVASRREVERYIEAGRVAINGDIINTPAVNVMPGDILTVDRKVIDEPEAARVWRYNKPNGLVTTHKDPKGRPTVFDNLPRGLPRVISVGRLDLNTEGLLLLTNDGELARALELPETGLMRRYRARARGRVTQEKLDTLKDGITIDGVHYGSIEARLDKANEGGTSANLWISLGLTEGKNREVRKVLEALGLTVNRLIRLSYGPFSLGDLPTGAVEEVGPRVIREQLGMHLSPERTPTGSGSAPAAPLATHKSRRAPTRGVGQGDEAKAKQTYKEGWARPNIKPSPHKPPTAKQLAKRAGAQKAAAERAAPERFTTWKSEGKPTEARGAAADRPKFAKPGFKSANPADRKPGEGKPVYQKSEGQKPGFKRPDAGRPGSGKPDSGRSDFGRPDFGKPAFQKPGAKAGYKKSGPRLETQKPGSEKAGSGKPGFATARSKPAGARPAGPPRGKTPRR